MNQKIKTLTLIIALSLTPSLYSKEEKQKESFKELFKNAKTKSNNKETDPSRFKSKFKKQRKTDNTSVAKLLKEVKTSKYKPTDTLENDISKIKRRLTINFNKLPKEELSTKVSMLISKEGKMNYKIIKKSKNKDFNRKIEKFLNKEKIKNFPNSKKEEIEIILNFQE